jgi:DNA invertase Pin-like site-specific DNA recombinase
MDRLARNLDDLRNVVSDLTARGVVVEFVKEKLTFTGADNAMSKLLLSVMGAFEEFERILLKERQREGIALTKKAGVYKGRKRALTPERAANSAIVLGQAKRKLRLRATSASAARCCTAISSPQVCLSFPMPEPGSMPRSA